MSISFHGLRLNGEITLHISISFHGLRLNGENKAKEVLMLEVTCVYCVSPLPIRWLAITDIAVVRDKSTLLTTRMSPNKSLMAIAQECYELYWTNPGVNIPQNNTCTATYCPSQKPSKIDEQDMWDEVISNVLL